MQIELLHDFIVLSGELNFRSAAAALFITPSTLSKHVAALEAHYGVRLFERDKTCVSLTNKGAALLEGAQKVWKDYEHTLDLINQDREASTLYISGMLDNPEDYPLVLPAITQFKESTGYNVHLIPSKSLSPKDQIALLKSGDSDCSIFYIDESTFNKLNNTSDIEFYHIGSAPLDALVSSSSPLASKQTLLLQDLENQTLIQLVGPRMTPSWLQLKSQLDYADIHYTTKLFPASTPYDYFDLNPGGSLFLLPRLGSSNKHAVLQNCVRIPIDVDTLSLKIAALIRKGSKQNVSRTFAQTLTKGMKQTNA